MTTQFGTTAQHKKFLFMRTKRVEFCSISHGICAVLRINKVRTEAMRKTQCLLSNKNKTRRRLRRHFMEKFVVGVFLRVWTFILGRRGAALHLAHINKANTTTVLYLRILSAEGVSEFRQTFFSF